MKKAHLGILVRYLSSIHPPFLERNYFKLLSQYGQQIGMNVTVFSPLSVNWEQKKVLGYRYDSKKKAWSKGYYPIPNVLYDRVAYGKRAQVSKYHPAIRKLTANGRTVLLGRGLPGKWKVYQMIKDIPEIQAYLPETIIYDSKLDWQKKLKQYGSLFFKPASGSHGKRVFRIWTQERQFLIQGRDAANRLFQKSFTSASLAQRWIQSFIGSRIYVVQPYLELSSPDQHPFDIRILFQKNSKGQWSETGRAVRIGKKESLTSNLDGGGTAVDASKFLAKWYTAERQKQINQDITMILTHLPSALEASHGPLIELGLDIGIDARGRVWIIEVNSKPGRDSFKLAKNRDAYELAVRTPVQYAQYIASQSGGNRSS